MTTFQPVRKQRVFEVIRDQVRQRLRDGGLEPGDKLPAERALAAEMDAHPNKLHRLYLDAEAAGKKPLTAAGDRSDT